MGNYPDPTPKVSPEILVQYTFPTPFKWRYAKCTVKSEAKQEDNRAKKKTQGQFYAYLKRQNEKKERKRKHIVVLLGYLDVILKIFWGAQVDSETGKIIVIIH